MVYQKQTWSEGLDISKVSEALANDEGDQGCRTSSQIWILLTFTPRPEETLDDALRPGRGKETSLNTSKFAAASARGSSEIKIRLAPAVVVFVRIELAAHLRENTPMFHAFKRPLSLRP